MACMTKLFEEKNLSKEEQDEIENKFLSKVIDEFKERPSIDFLLDKSLNKFNSVLCEINKSDARSMEKIIKIFEDNYTF